MSGDARLTFDLPAIARNAIELCRLLRQLCPIVGGPPRVTGTYESFDSDVTAHIILMQTATDLFWLFNPDREYRFLSTDNAYIILAGLPLEQSHALVKLRETFLSKNEWQFSGASYDIANRTWMPGRLPTVDPAEIDALEDAARRLMEVGGVVMAPDAAKGTTVTSDSGGQLAASDADHVRFIEFVRDNIRHAAEMKRKQFTEKYSNETLTKAIHVDLWELASERIALLADVPTDAVNQVAGVLRRELSIGTVVRIDELLGPAVDALRDAFEQCKHGKVEAPVLPIVDSVAADRSSLADLIGRVIRRLQANPDLIRNRIWDHPETLNISAINAAANELGLGPIFAIGDAPDWASWPNLPPDHPNNQHRIECLTIYHPDGTDYRIRRTDGMLDDMSIFPSTETIARLEAWADKAADASTNVTKPVAIPFNWTIDGQPLLIHLRHYQLAFKLAAADRLPAGLAPPTGGWPTKSILAFDWPPMGWESPICPIDDSIPALAAWLRFQVSLLAGMEQMLRNGGEWEKLSPSAGSAPYRDAHRLIRVLRQSDRLPECPIHETKGDRDAHTALLEIEGVLWWVGQQGSGNQPALPINADDAKGMSKDDANAAASRLSLDDPGFRELSGAKMASRIGCGVHTIMGTAFWAKLCAEQPHRRRSKGPTPKAAELTDAVMAKAEQTTELDPLANLIAAEEQAAIDRVMESGLGDVEKAATVQKLCGGEMTPQQAIEIAAMHPLASIRPATPFKSI